MSQDKPTEREYDASRKRGRVRNGVVEIRSLDGATASNIRELQAEIAGLRNRLRWEEDCLDEVSLNFGERIGALEETQKHCDTKKPFEVWDGTCRLNLRLSHLKKGDTLVLKIMTDAPDLEISTVTSSDASQAYLEARKQDARDRKAAERPGRLSPCDDCGKTIDGLAVTAGHDRLERAGYLRRDSEGNIPPLFPRRCFKCTSERLGRPPAPMSGNHVDLDFNH